jgi:hypothetical protein
MKWAARGACHPNRVAPMQKEQRTMKKEQSKTKEQSKIPVRSLSVPEVVTACLPRSSFVICSLLFVLLLCHPNRAHRRIFAPLRVESGKNGSF